MVVDTNQHIYLLSVRLQVCMSTCNVRQAKTSLTSMVADTNQWGKQRQTFRLIYDNLKEHSHITQQFWNTFWILFMTGPITFYFPSNWQKIKSKNSIVRCGNTGLWWMNSNKHGQGWRKAIALLFQSSSFKITTGSSFWFVCSNTPYRS